VPGISTHLRREDMRRLHVSICLFTIVLAAGSTCFAAEKSNLRVKVSTFGKTPDGRTIEL